MLTLDLQILGQRHKDLKNGLSAPPKPTLANHDQPDDQAALVPGHAGHPRRQFGNIVGHVRASPTWANLGEWTAQQFDPRLNWGDVEWIKKALGRQADPQGHPGRRGREAAADSGADALIVSNHGGRQLDGAESSIRALPSIAEAVGSQIEVHMDGGVRSGQDVLKAWALARAPTSAAPSYGLGAMGFRALTRTYTARTPRKGMPP